MSVDFKKSFEKFQKEILNIELDLNTQVYLWNDLKKQTKNKLFLINNSIIYDLVCSKLRIICIEMCEWNNLIFKFLKKCQNLQNKYILL
jgi:hypothetical protein